MRWSCLVLAVWLLAPAPAAAEWQLRPFIGFTFGGATTFVDPEKAIETQNAVIGASGGWLGEIFGLEVDFGRAPGFFQTDETSAASDPDLLSSAVTTLTGNVVIALPSRMAGYGLRRHIPCHSPRNRRARPESSSWEGPSFRPAGWFPAQSKD